VQATLNQRRKEAGALDRLSLREREVMALVVQGRTSKEIARIVGVKPATVDTYRSRLMAKLDVPDICGLVRFAIRQGMLTP
jgi:DNA-binding CsgD family transcriptional regulator